MKNILLLFALFGFAVMISCSSQLASKKARPVDPDPVLVFEKKSPDTLPPVLKASTQIVAPDTVRMHTETIREVLDTAAISQLLNEHRATVQEVIDLESKVISKLVSDYNASIDANQELVRKYFQAQEEKALAEGKVENMKTVFWGSSTMMFILCIVIPALILLKQYYSRVRIVREIKRVQNCRKD